ncbi:hypothetical protein [uncultured phage]|nr:hypothetical protein [uncultured phage]
MSDNYGYISLHRKIMQNFLFKEKRPFSKFEAWLFLLMSANHNDSKFLLGNELIEVKKGSFVTSEVKLMDQFLWSKSKLRAFLNLLQSEKMIEKNTDKKKTTLTIVKYSDYQQIETTKRPQKDYKKTTKRPQKDTNNNDNNYNNDNNLNNNTIIISDNSNNTVDYEFYFNLFWNAYDKKEGRSKSFDKFKKIKPELYDLIIDKATEYKKSTPDIQFRKNPLTWLNGQHWEDEIVINKTKNNETGSKSDQYMDALFNLANRYKNS